MEFIHRNMDKDYHLNMLADFDDISRGALQLNDWTHMLLKKDLQEGKDYVLVSSEVWYHVGPTG